MHLTIDFETRSEVNLPKMGPWSYAEHPSTEVMCMALKADDKEPWIWIPSYFYSIVYREIPRSLGQRVIPPPDAVEMLEMADIIEAHNVMFERAMYQEVMLKRHGWPAIPEEKWRCSAAKAAAMALPRSLGEACKALDLPIKKDEVGRRVMLKLCKPRKPTKHNKAKWNEDPADLITLFKYCIQDVESEHALSKALPDLNAKEQIIWSIDQKINMRGIPVDLDFANTAIDVIEDHEENLLAELKELTGGKVGSPKQVAVLQEWINNQLLKADRPF